MNFPGKKKAKSVLKYLNLPTIVQKSEMPNWWTADNGDLIGPSVGPGYEKNTQKKQKQNKELLSGELNIAGSLSFQ